ncbi:MAG: transposase [Chloroflexales bacterium]|nr:transposase [Chloroflexales bacterium]
MIADRADDTNAVRQMIADQEADIVIPPHPRRVQPMASNREVYKERHLIECFINKIKHYRRVFTRYEKRACRYADVLALVSAIIWLR